MGKFNGIKFTRQEILKPILDWFQRQGWQPLPFQRETWEAYLAGHSGLVQVPTGSGKTYAAVMGAIAELLHSPGKGLQLLYITPLRALARDIEQSIRQPITEMGWALQVESRTGDTSSSRKSRQLKNMPDILITTPESLSVMLSYPDAPKRFGSLRMVILDEWHELLSSKRGTQTELCLARLRSIQPALRSWALSATLGNVQAAAQAAVGLTLDPVIIQANLCRTTVIRSILPDSVDTFPWAGHLGLRMLDELLHALDIETSTLIFTNTRSQSERWFQAISLACPDDENWIALHHGSIDVKQREAIEAGVKAGEIKWVVCTSSLDLGVDFQPVERVVQIGSAKNLARLLQRAGRSAHVPEGTSEILFLPTNALELLEISAFRRGLEAGAIESRPPLNKPYDVLVQHLVTLACGDGFQADAMFAEIRQTVAYQDLTREEFDWILDFITTGGKCLHAYPRYRKVTEQEGLYQVTDAQIAKMHRMGIGTIASSQAVRIVYTNRKEIGTVEENFVSRLKKGDVFFFAGRQLEFFQLKDMVAYVKGTTRKSTITPIWYGGNLTISDTLSDYLRQELASAKIAVQACDNSSQQSSGKSSQQSSKQSSQSSGKNLSTKNYSKSSTKSSTKTSSQSASKHSKSFSPALNAELTCIQPILHTQERISHIPDNQELLIELCQTREGQHLYVFPFAGRFVHEGLGFLWGYRFAAQHQATFTISVNDYGFEILAPKDYPFQELFSEEFLSLDNLDDHIRASLNLSEITGRRFREIAQISGLVFKGYPSAKKTTSQLQVSASLIYDVFAKYEPDNLLLKQAEQEVRSHQLETQRLTRTLADLRQMAIVWKRTKRPSPLAFPLLVERLNSRLSNESLLERIERMKRQWEKQ